MTDNLSTSTPIAKENSTARDFCEFYSRSTYSLVEPQTWSASERLAVANNCRRPEFRPLLVNVRFALTDNFHNPFWVKPNGEIELSRKILSDTHGEPFHFCHMLEIRAHKAHFSKANDILDLAVIALSACHTTLSYFEGLIDAERTMIRSRLPSWTMKLINAIRHAKNSSQNEVALLSIIAQYFEYLMPLQLGHQSESLAADVIEKAISRTSKFVSLLYPTAQILTHGGDNRLTLNGSSGLNAYGCSPRPRPWAITFSSCTASSISEMAFQQADWLRQDLIGQVHSGNLRARLTDEHAKVRQEISQLIELDHVPGTEVLLASSGTDAELHALYFALGGSSQPILNIVVSSAEIGSGTIFAAGGYHFDNTTPLGVGVEKGKALGGFPCNRVEVATVELRSEGGELRTADEVNSTVEALVGNAIEAGQRILLHLLDCSKTGIGGPSFKLAQALRRAHPNDVEVVVDAAQMRITNYSLHKYLHDGFMVIISVSKFFTGPPFAGALLVPQPLASRIGSMHPLPAGFRDYNTRDELPPAWGAIKSTLSDIVNYGLLLRWRAALWEMNAFYSVAPKEKLDTIATFGNQVIRMIEQNDDVELLMAPLIDRHYPDGAVHWDQLPTIFTFMPYHHSSGQRNALRYDEARRAYHLINTDASQLLPIRASDREYELMRKRCHIGQPVRIQASDGEIIGALRIAAGARLVSGTAFDDALGESPEARLATEIRTAGVVFSKLSVILKYWNYLTETEYGDLLYTTYVQTQF